MTVSRFVSARAGAIFLYLFFAVILYLAAAYLGPLFVFTFAVFVSAPALSVLLTLLTVATLKYHQTFSNDHPLKGEEVVYVLAVSKESILPSGAISLRLKGSRQGMSLGLSDIDVYPAANRRFRFEHTIKCPFRGVYVVGLDSIEVRGYYGWLSIHLPAWVRTFYVYPRIIELRDAPFAEEGSSVSLPGATRGSEEDITLLESVRPYSPGDPVRHISWKKFAALGTPATRRYESSAQPGVTIVLDTRGGESKNERMLETEDCSVEIAVALAKFYSEAGIRTAVIGDGVEPFHFAGRDDALFRRFHRSTVSVFFESGVSPLRVVEEELLSNRHASGMAIVVTHFADPEILESCERTVSPVSVAAIVNLSGRTAEARDRALRSIRLVRERGGSVRPVFGAETIAEDIAR